MFGKLFSSKKQEQPRKSGHEESLGALYESMGTLRQTVDTLEKRQAFLEKKVATCLQTAKLKASKKDKRGALFELKKKKQIEQVHSLQFQTHHRLPSIFHFSVHHRYLYHHPHLHFYRRHYFIIVIIFVVFI